MNLKSKVILITGACGRIGSAAALKCAEYGSHLIISDIDYSNLKGLKQKIINSFDVDVLMVKCNITNQEEINNLIKLSFNYKGFVSGAINSAYPTSQKWGCLFEDLEAENLKEDLYFQLGSAIIFAKVILKVFQSRIW